MLKLSGELAITGKSGPFIAEDFNFPGAFVNHRLDGENHTRPKTPSLAALAVMGNFGRSVENVADAMSDKVPDYRKTLWFGVLLNGCTNVSDAGIRLDLSDALSQAFLCYLN